MLASLLQRVFLSNRLKRVYLCQRYTLPTEVLSCLVTVTRSGGVAPRKDFISRLSATAPLLNESQSMLHAMVHLDPANIPQDVTIAPRPSFSHSGSQTDISIGKEDVGLLFPKGLDLCWAATS